ncbi:hypothetical protein IKD48_01380 [bacterium]|nr:hypothetical protein [bacterium]
MLKVLHHPINDKLSFLALAISSNANAIAKTAIPTNIQHIIAKIIEPCDPSSTALALKKIPEPIQLPTTTSIAEKNEILFLVVELAKLRSVFKISSFFNII